MCKTFRGSRVIGRREPEVTVTHQGKTRPLAPPGWEGPNAYEGWEWGGVNQLSVMLASSILAEALRHEELIEALALAFTRERIAHFPAMGWTITADEIERWATGYIADLFGVCADQCEATRGVHL